MIKKLFLGLAVVLVALCGFIATRPSTFTLQRTATFKAPPDIAFALVNDFHHWGGWSPWNKLDPSQKITFTGAAMGVGSQYDWSGNDKVGEGRMSIEESKANELVRIKLEFIRPFASIADTRFTFSPTSEGSTTVTWRIEEQNHFMQKAVSLVLDMDKLIGKDFENGLAALRTLAEAEAQKQLEAQAAKRAAEAAALPAPGAAPVEGQPAAGGGQMIAAPTP